MCVNWMISKKNVKYDKDFFKQKFENDDFQILFENPVDIKNYYWDEVSFEGVFIIGYLLPTHKMTESITPKNILKLYKKNNADSFLKYKGNYTIIIVLPVKVVILSDVFGISKFFFNDKIASNNFWVFNNYSNQIISEEAVYLYLIFNYWIKDYTILHDVYKSEGGYYYEINNQLKKYKYFDLKCFLRNREIIYNSKSTFNIAPEVWTGILKEYLNYFDSERISQTLTAGLDSRMILAGLQKQNFKPMTFTFGNEDSTDVIFAKKVANTLNLPHSHYYPDNDFFNDFSTKAEEVLHDANGLTTMFRAHRFDAYKKLSKISDVIFFGFIGSELIRGGVYPDGLIYPNFVIDYWLGNKISVKNILIEKMVDINSKTLKIVEEKIFEEYDFYKEPDTHIFELIVPLHFGQDIRLLESLGTKSVAPYWDIDFLNFQKSTPYFIDNIKKKKFASLGHYKRVRGPVYSCKMIEMLSPANAQISLGKGYTPSDYNLSVYYASIKFLLNKYKFGNQVRPSNFVYGNWFQTALNKMMSTPMPKFIDEISVINSLSRNNKTDEFGLLPLVNPLNIALIYNIMQIKNSK